METGNYFKHASSQAPWRTERQWISVALLIVLGFAIITALYLMVTSQAAIFGREIQKLSREIIMIEYNNADLQTELAKLTSKNEVEKRAYGLGFRPIEPGELEYLYVPGYVAPDSVKLADTHELQPAAITLKPEYTQSLLEWFEERLRVPGGGLR